MNKGHLLGHEIQAPSYCKQLSNMKLLINGSSALQHKEKWYLAPISLI